jgi:hypothetical protein
VFDWLMAALSYQGIADAVAYDYMERHGRAAWRDIDQKLGQAASCPKLKSHWHFHGCRYEKGSRSCAEPEHIGACPLPSHDLRNGHLNQAAYSLFLFIRDLADGDLIGWIDAQLQGANSPPGPDRLTRMAAALIEPMREIYGVSDKLPPFKRVYSCFSNGSFYFQRLSRHLVADVVGAKTRFQDKALL